MKKHPLHPSNSACWIIHLYNSTCWVFNVREYRRGNQKWKTRETGNIWYARRR